MLLLLLAQALARIATAAKAAEPSFMAEGERIRSSSPYTRGNAVRMADPLAAGADLGKVYGDGNRCPACGAFARVVPSEEYRWVCGVCGAPRIVMPDGEPLPNEAELALTEAGGALRAWGIQRLLAFALGVPSAIVLLLGVVLGLASFVAAGVLFVTGVLLAVLASRASRKGATEKKRARAASERAYEAAITTLMSKNLVPAEVAAKLRIPEADVEAAMAATGHVRVAAPARIAQPATEPLDEDEDDEEKAEKAR